MSMKPHALVTAAPSKAEVAADALCMECGLCCDGTIFGSVVVAEDERERLGRVGLRVVDRDGALQMPQRCSALRGCLCDVYADRPGACVRYECSQRKALRAGSITEEEGRTNVARMRTLVASVREAFDLGTTTSIWEAILALEEPPAFEKGSPTARKYDAGIDAVTELLTLGRAAFEPAFAGGGNSSSGT